MCFSERLCFSCRDFATRAMAFERSPDQAGPSYVPSAPLPGTFFGPTLDLTSEKLYDLAPAILDVMGLRALRPSAAVVKVMSVPDSRCIQVVTLDDHVTCHLIGSSASVVFVTWLWIG